MTVDLTEAILDLRDEGLGYDAIAERLGVTKGKVAGVLYRDRTAGARPDTGLKALNARLRWDVISVGGCRWVLGTPGYGPGRDAWRWCGEPLSDVISPYCAAHVAASRTRAAPLIHSTGRQRHAQINDMH